MKKQREHPDQGARGRRVRSARRCAWYTIVDGKVGVAIGVTKNLTKKYNAVELIKLGSKVIGGTGGGGRNDFAQAGGNLPEKIEKSFQTIIEKI